jgi:arsenate reductase (thioredoxin)
MQAAMWAVRASRVQNLCVGADGTSRSRSLTTIIFACAQNAGRSQIAAAYFNLAVDRSKARAISAGTAPGPHVHPEVVAAMREEGVDVSGARPQRLTDALAASADWLITMGCGDGCPTAPGARRDDWPLPDPKGQPIARVRVIREEIRLRVEAFVEDQGWG